MVLQNSSDPTDPVHTYDILLFTGNVALGESCLHSSLAGYREFLFLLLRNDENNFNR